MSKMVIYFFFVVGVYDKCIDVFYFLKEDYILYCNNIKCIVFFGLKDNGKK